jgi:multiple sugar transport system substrate-binding protein
MSLRSIALAWTLPLAVLIGPAHAATEISVQYPYSFLFDTAMNEIKAAFEKQVPDVKVTFRPAYKDYEDGAQTALRNAIVKQLPDVAFQAINLQRPFVDRGIAVDVSPFIAKEVDWKGQGFSDSMMALGTFKGKPYGLAFAVSTPIIYINEDLVRKAGGDPDNFPQNWADIIVLAKKIQALGNDTVGLFYSWAVTGNFMWQGLIFANGGSMLTADESKVAFDGEAGQRAAHDLDRMVKEGGMPNLAQEAARQTFFGGKMGIWTESTSLLRVADDGVAGKFKWRSVLFPVPGPNPRLPTGGNAALMFTTDPAKQLAAWQFMKFATGPIGATIMVKTTGYMPPNSVPATDPNMLGAFYATHPNHLTSIRQQKYMTGWYAFPGDNGLKIIDVMKDHLQSIVDQSTPSDRGLKQMASDVQALLPK